MAVKKAATPTRKMGSVTFSQLHVAPAKQNARKTVPSQAAMDSLKASIAAHGILQPLLVEPLSGVKTPGGKPAFRVVAGSRRREAIGLLIREKKFDKEFSIPVLIGGFSSGALDSSLAENIMREPMHPVDEFEAFEQLRSAEKMTVEQIAASYGLSEKHVLQRLALGGIHKDIRAAWRNKEIGRETAEAFTLAGDPKDQLELFNKLRKNGFIYPSQVKNYTIGAGDKATMIAIDFVGLDAYRKAGGKLVEDLFGDNHKVENPEIANRLAIETMEAECRRLVADGWAWANLLVNPNLNKDQNARATAFPANERVFGLSKTERAIYDAIPDGKSSPANRKKIDEMTLAAFNRAWPKKDRGQSGVFVYLGDDLHGAAIFRRAGLPADFDSIITKPVEAATERKSRKADTKPEEQKTDQQESQPSPDNQSHEFNKDNFDIDDPDYRFFLVSLQGVKDARSSKSMPIEFDLALERAVLAIEQMMTELKSVRDKRKEDRASTSPVVAE